jgi:hypothetical protein
MARLSLVSQSIVYTASLAAGRPPRRRWTAMHRAVGRYINCPFPMRA